MKRPAWILATAVTLAALISGASALGDEEGGARAGGVCSDGSEYEIIMAPEVGLSFETEIEPGEEMTNRLERQTWHIVMVYRGGVVVDARVRTDEDGGVVARRVWGNLRGVDIVEMKALNLDTGEECEGSLEAEL